MRYAVVIERSATGFGAYVPDLLGVGVTGATLKEVEELVREAVTMHLDGLREDGLTIPEPSTICEYVET